MEQETKKVALRIICFTGQVILYLLGGMSILWAFLCYLGGPDPRPGDLGLHLGFGTLWLVVGLAFIFGGRKAGWMARNQLNHKK